MLVKSIFFAVLTLLLLLTSSTKGEKLKKPDQLVPYRLAQAGQFFKPPPLPSLQTLNTVNFENVRLNTDTTYNCLTYEAPDIASPDTCSNRHNAYTEPYAFAADHDPNASLTIAYVKRAIENRRMFYSSTRFDFETTFVNNVKAKRFSDFTDFHKKSSLGYYFQASTNWDFRWLAAVKENSNQQEVSFHSEYSVFDDYNPEYDENANILYGLVLSKRPLTTITGKENYDDIAKMLKAGQWKEENQNQQGNYNYLYVVNFMQNQHQEKSDTIWKTRKNSVIELRLPTPDHFEPTSFNIVTSVFFTLDAFAKKHPVVHHCHGGHGRSGASAVAVGIALFLFNLRKESATINVNEPLEFPGNNLKMSIYVDNNNRVHLRRVNNHLHISDAEMYQMLVYWMGLYLGEEYNGWEMRFQFYKQFYLLEANQYIIDNFERIFARYSEVEVLNINKVATDLSERFRVYIYRENIPPSSFEDHIDSLGFCFANKATPNLIPQGQYYNYKLLSEHSEPADIPDNAVFGGIVKMYQRAKKSGYIDKNQSKMQKQDVHNRALVDFVADGIKSFGSCEPRCTSLDYGRQFEDTSSAAIPCTRDVYVSGDIVFREAIPRPQKQRRFSYFFPFGARRNDKKYRMRYDFIMKPEKKGKRESGKCKRCSQKLDVTFTQFLYKQKTSYSFQSWWNNYFKAELSLRLANGISPTEAFQIIKRSGKFDHTLSIIFQKLTKATIKYVLKGKSDRYCYYAVPETIKSGYKFKWAFDQNGENVKKLPANNVLHKVFSEIKVPVRF